MDTIQFYVIQTVVFSETISFWHLVVPLNNFASISNCLLMQGKSNKPPHPHSRCVWRGKGENSCSMILPQFLVLLYAMRYVYIWLLDEGRVKSYRYGLML